LQRRISACYRSIDTHLHWLNSGLPLAAECG
jgi:hypothetical protein